MERDLPPGDAESPRWDQVLDDNDLLSGLDAVVHEELASELTPVRLGVGEALVQQGDPGDAMYVVVSGRLRAVLEPRGPDERVLGEMGYGEAVGEISLLTGQTRTATVYAVEETTLARLSKEGFEGILRARPEIADELNEALTSHIRRRQLRHVLRATPLFGQLDPKVLKALEDELTWITIPGGEALVTQGDPSDCMFVIVSGRVRIVVNQGPGAERVLRELARGETLGEIGLLTGGTRTATAYAIRDTELAKLSQEGFNRLLERYPHDITRTLTRTIADIVVLREGRRPRKAPHSCLSVAVLRAGAAEVPSEAVTRLARAFTPLGPPLHLSSEIVDRALGKTGISQEEAGSEAATAVQLTGWLSEEEGNFSFLIYEADPTLTPWTRRCLRQADHVVWVADAEGDPDLSRLERELREARQETRQRSSLVLLHRNEDELPTGTRRWLGPRSVDQHAHVRRSRDADFRRVARTVAGKAVGLTLGGGGARGAAHIGVLQALEDADIPVDMVGGTSIGATLAGLYAMGWSPDDIAARLWETSKRAKMSATLPVVAITTGKDQVILNEAMYGDAEIEDLWIPYFCISTNLTRAEIMVHRTGTLWKAVRASGSAPGIFPPVVEDGDLLVDGALLDNLPVDVMRIQCGGGTVVAVDVTPPVDLAEIEPYGDELSGWTALFTQLNPVLAKGKVPNIFSLLYRAGQVGSLHKAKSQMEEGIADLYLRPPLDDFGMLEWKALDRMVKLGYEYAEEEIARWKASAVPAEERSQAETPEPAPKKAAKKASSRSNEKAGSAVARKAASSKKAAGAKKATGAKKRASPVKRSSPEKKES